MLGIIKKDIGKYALNALVIPLISLYWIFTRHTLDLGMAFPLGMLLFIMITGSVTLCEHYEDRYHGYEFLRGLPIGAARIVATKFILPLVMAIILTGYILLVFSLFDASVMILHISHTIVLVCAMTGLWFSAANYLAISLFGFAHVVRYGGIVIASFLLFLGTVTQILIRKSIIPHFDILLMRAIDFMAGLNQAVILAFGLALYGMGLLIVVRLQGPGTMK